MGSDCFFWILIWILYSWIAHVYWLPQNWVKVWLNISIILVNLSWLISFAQIAPLIFLRPSPVYFFIPAATLINLNFLLLKSICLLRLRFLRISYRGLSLLVWFRLLALFLVLRAFIRGSKKSLLLWFLIISQVSRHKDCFLVGLREGSQAETHHFFRLLYMLRNILHLSL